MGRSDAGQTGGSNSDSLRTRSRSRADPEWTVQDMLILVNEIAAVEGECQNALSSYQKWSIIAENCTGLGVVRKLNQCRRKWESLHVEYKLVKEWEANSRNESYWSLECERRKESGLPLDFDKELFKAIDDFTKAPERADTDPEDDPEAAEVDVLDDTVESGPKPKRIRHRSTPQKEITEERKQSVLAEEHEIPAPVVEQMEQILADKLKENTELIHAIIAGNITETLNNESSGLKDEETQKSERLRCKAEKLISCLGDLTKNLKQLYDAVEEC